MTWTMDPAHSAVTFSAKHMMVTTVRGSVAIREVDLDFAPDRPEASSVRVVLDAASIDTGQTMRDEHLRSPDFLETEAHPTIEFASTRIEPRRRRISTEPSATTTPVKMVLASGVRYFG